jgi:hypothetical protein
MAQKILMVFGVVLVLVGILGFVPGITNDDGLLLGIFAVDAIHNIIHLASGILAVVFARMGAAQASMFAKILGIVYAIVAVVGLLQGDSVLGIIGVNMADNILHVLLAIVFLYVGFSKSSTSSMPMQA